MKIGIELICTPDTTRALILLIIPAQHYTNFAVLFATIPSPCVMKNAIYLGASHVSSRIRESR